MAPDARGTRPDEASQAVLELVRTLATELSPRLDVRQVSLDSPLSEELGLDSLGRVELMSRLEHTFGVALPESTLFGAETPRDLVLALAHAPRGAAVALQPAPLPEASAAGFPTQARTLVEALAWHVQAHADRPHLYVLEERGPHVIDYGTLWRNALRAAEGLRARDLIPGQRIGLMLPTSTAYFECFFGILLAGGVPVPIYPPFRPAGLEDHLLRQAGILANAESPLLIAIPEAQRFARLLQARVASLHTVLAPAELQSNASGRPATPTSDDMALVQYTSGSTGRPKGVVLTHANLLANVRAMGRVARVSPEDVFVSWLPLYHDMGLIGAWFGSMYHGIPLVVMPPTAFLARPERWLWAIHQYHATLSAAPNFAYELCARKIPDAAIAGLDLASWRMACNGSEPVSPDTLERFAARFAPSGFRGEALAPVYGLAESAVGLAFTPPGRGPRIDRVRRGPLERAGLAEPAASDDSEAVRLVSCGEPLPGHQIRVVDEAGRELPERHVGRLE
ncbi:MAG TPA: AMP-binding protein, partial [Oscillatoriaceae cyanobacterium]